MALQGDKHALVFGSSGISGWAHVNELLGDYPSKGIWGNVTALTNRPLSKEVSQWPDDNRLNIVSGIDLLEGSQEQLEQDMKAKIPDIATVTHVYYFAYKASTDMTKELKDAVEMLARSITAIDHLSPALEFVVLQTGAKMYGFTLFEDHYFPVPLKESLPRLKQPWHDQIFYHPQLDWISSYAKTKKWTWNETRPDIIVGFVPNNNAYSIAGSLAIYFSLWVELEGKGSEVPFPGTIDSWKAKSNEAGSDMIARQSIFLSLNPETCGNGEAFNVASSPKWETWETRWPELCAYFGLKSAPPSDKAKEVRRYINDHMDEWRQIVRKYGLRSDVADSPTTLPGFEIIHLKLADFDRQYDMSKIQSAGFNERHSIMDTWGTTFDRMRKAKIIP